MYARVCRGDMCVCVCGNCEKMNVALIALNFPVKACVVCIGSFS